jgi:phage gp29-like protein
MVEILGPDGQPARQARPVRDDQTSRLGWLHREIGDHPTRGLTPARLASVYRRAEEGDLTAQARLAMDMEEKDAHLFCELSKRRLAVQAVAWHIEPPADATPAEEQAADLCRQILDVEIDMQDLLYDLTDAILHSYAGCEYHWQLIDGVNVPTQPEMRPADWFQADYQNYQFSRLLLRDQTGAGTALRPLNWILHIQRSRSGYLTRAGLVRVLGWPFLMRALSTRDLAEFLEIYGLPLRLGKYPVGSSDKEKATLLRAVVGIGHAAAGIIPEGMSIEFQEAAKAGAGGDPFMRMMEWAERSISKAILGGTLTTTAQSTGLGSNVADTHNEVRKEIAASDRRQLKRTIEQQLLRPITALNTTAERAPLFVWDDEEPADMEAMSNALPGLVEAGLQISRKWAHDRLKIPLAEEGEEVLTRPSAPSASPFPPPPAAARQQITGPHAACNASEATPQGRIQQQVVDKLARDAGPGLQAMLAEIRRWVDEADSLEALRDRILQGYGNLPTAELSQLMGDAFAVAHALGRDNVAREAGQLADD